MITNAIIIHPTFSFIKSLSHLFNKRLESKIISFDEAKNILSKLKEKNVRVGFEGETIAMKKENALDFLDKNFKETNNQNSIAKYESFQTSKGEINYLSMYKNHVTLQNENEIIFANYMTPLRATIAYLT